MAKGKSNRGLRDTPDIATRDPLVQVLAPAVRVSPLPQRAAYNYSPDLFDDSRYWSPEGPGLNRPAVHQSGRPARLRVSDPLGKRIRNRQTKAVIAFQNPRLDPVTTCVRRKTRRQVLHALRRTRRGGGGRPRRTWRSLVKC